MINNEELQALLNAAYVLDSYGEDSLADELRAKAEEFCNPDEEGEES